MKVCDGKESVRRRLKIISVLVVSRWSRVGSRLGGEGGVCFEVSFVWGYLSKGFCDVFLVILGYI